MFATKLRSVQSEIQLLQEQVWDIVVVGAGPNGLFAASRLKEVFPGFEILVLEKGRPNQSLHDYPNVRWHSTMGEIKLPLSVNSMIPDEHLPLSNEVAKYFDFFALNSGLKILRNTMLTYLERKSVGQDITLEVSHQGTNYQFVSQYVILSTGTTSNPRELNINDKSDFQTSFGIPTSDQQLLVVGGGNYAADFVMEHVEENKITWVVRGETIASVNQNHKERFNHLTQNFKRNLSVYTDTTVKTNLGGGWVELSSGQKLGPFDKMYSLIGSHPISPYVLSSGLRISGESIWSDANWETSLQNAYVFGSAMARWDGEKRKLEPTYIHNGNPQKLEKIIQSLIAKEAKKILMSGVSSAQKQQNGLFNKILSLLRSGS